jgi:hypothetical protein
MIVYRCTNPECKETFDRDIMGHCPLCLCNGSGWSTVAVEREPWPSTRPNIVLSNGKIVRHTRQLNGSQLATLASGEIEHESSWSAMNTAEWMEYCSRIMAMIQGDKISVFVKQETTDSLRLDGDPHIGW